MTGALAPGGSCIDPDAVAADNVTTPSKDKSKAENKTDARKTKDANRRIQIGKTALC